ncbi:HAD-IIA family hydrolase [Herbiconiux sp. SYSU D00978]|uniref:HAD-IIA family hydrolase n=1 Tax=Herbiconiux sp. SYSU D00978 TaxID=2812562 RepID=UPI001A97886D|nr:HAD-IIA family hydrolase [Herbiconiux sp. SYSU D00978]
MIVAGSPLDGVELVLADLDGVVYRGKSAIPHAVEALNQAHRDVPVGYITNNASRTPETVAGQLAGYGLAVTPTDVVTSPQAAMVLLEQLVEPGATVLVVGGEGLTTAVEGAGFVVTRSAEDDPAAVVQGFSPELGWKDLAEAAFALHRGIPWVATNQDWTLPLERGTAPGNGTLVSAVHTAVGRLPQFAGKPEVPIFTAALERFSASSALMIGDRLDTDILGANRAGLASLLVLTGIDQAKQVLAAEEEYRPHFIVDDLRGLHEPYPEIGVSLEQSTGARLVHVGDAVVRLHKGVVSVDRPGSPIDRLRAGCIAVWGSGVKIYSLDVAPELYS